jgi:PadR family transcriptional regulator, regulatory protein PadR
MPRPPRVTGPLLDVSECLLRAREEGGAVHGWALMKRTKRSGPTIYGVLDRLEDCGWIVGSWEDLGPEDSRPRRRFYQLTAEGEAGVRILLEQRRPQALSDLGRRSPGGVVRRLAPGPNTFTRLTNCRASASPLIWNSERALV